MTDVDEVLNNYLESYETDETFNNYFTVIRRAFIAGYKAAGGTIVTGGLIMRYIIYDCVISTQTIH